MAENLDIVYTESEMRVGLERYRDTESSDVRALVTKLGGGVMRLARMAFPGTNMDELFVQSFERESQGRGPHFDLYAPYLNSDHPWIAIFNKQAEVDLLTTDLPEDLASVYFNRYPETSNEAYDARRSVSQLALQAPGAHVLTARLKPGMGFILPQRDAGPHIVHDVTPAGSIAGQFIKILSPKTGSESSLRVRGYMTFDEYLASDGPTHTSLQQPSRVAREGSDFSREETSDPPRRHPCNLD